MLGFGQNIEPQRCFAAKAVAIIGNGAVFGKAFDGGFANAKVFIRNGFNSLSARHILSAG